jgi:hypothetical protein
MIEVSDLYDDSAIIRLSELKLTEKRLTDDRLSELKIMEKRLTDDIRFNEQELMGEVVHR